MNIKIIGLFITGATLLLSANPASARLFRRGVCVSNVCHNVVETPVVEVVTPIAVPILIPAYQFQYSPPCAVPVAAGYQSSVLNYSQPTEAGYQQQQPVGLGYGQSMPVASQGHGATTGPINSQDKIRDLAKALLDEMQRQSAPQDDGPPMVPGDNQEQTRESAGGHWDRNASTYRPALGPPGLPASSVASPEQAAPIAIAALQRNCSSCHTGVAAKGDFVMFSQPGLFNQQVAWRSIVREIDAGRMPPRASQFRITPQEASAVRVWLNGI